MNQVLVAKGRSAFTLIETLLALALSSALLLAVFSMIDSTVAYHVSGNDQVLVSQRLIGLLQDLRSDVRSVQADPHWQAVPELRGDLEDQLESASTRLNSQLILPNMEKFAEPIRLAGQNNWLLLTLGHANPRWSQDAEYAQQIVWSLGGRGSINVSTHDDRGRVTNRVIPGLAQPGLLRTRILAGDNSAAKSQSEFIIAADDLQFRFLAQGQWQSEWNSSKARRLPDAIEVSLQLAGDAERRTWVIQTSSLLPVRAAR